jgi:hypothetical protein
MEMSTNPAFRRNAAALENATALGAAFDAAKSDDSFDLPPEAFSNPEFRLQYLHRRHRVDLQRHSREREIRPDDRRHCRTQPDSAHHDVHHQKPGRRGGTVALSLGASFGFSVLVWQDILGIPLYWVGLALAIILLLAVGSDYNLLLISRFKGEIGAGLNTGIIRARRARCCGPTDPAPRYGSCRCGRTTK